MQRPAPVIGSGIRPPARRPRERQQWHEGPLTLSVDYPLADAVWEAKERQEADPAFPWERAS